ncbi:hypothetical protein K435DRAFT_377304 [Dendrothele bispora CBS 962.96]|uniref:Uncharacterized protein n=1 Tax=Dendrothele bispora (strain CBS 962.96) TaxID=1314807 RepID=A0A4S8MH80_DENBC|nr:hypothetical protein K435DRAFT_377304 [Dendrothele bispora CBS 962.96]
MSRRVLLTFPFRLRADGKSVNSQRWQARKSFYQKNHVFFGGRISNRSPVRKIAKEGPQFFETRFIKPTIYRIQPNLCNFNLLATRTPSHASSRHLPLPICNPMSRTTTTYEICRHNPLPLTKEPRHDHDAHTDVSEYEVLVGII